jgi:hypothetical protein
MAADIKGLEDRLTLLPSFDSVVSVFSTPLDIDEEHIEKDLASLLTSEAAVTLLAEAGRELLAAEAGPWGGNAVHAFLTRLAPADTYPPVRWSTWAEAPKVVLRRLQDVAGHKIGEDAWYTAVVDWILAGRASIPSATSAPLAPQFSVPAWIACQWRTKLLFSNRPGEPPTLLQYWPPESLDATEQDEWAPLVRKAVPHITIPQFPDITSGSPLALATLAAIAFMAFASKKREGSTAGNPANLSGAMGDSPGSGDPLDPSAQSLRSAT